MLKLSTIFKVLAACALLMGFGLVAIGGDAPEPIQPLIQGDGADYDLKEQLAPVHQDPEENNPDPSAEEIFAKKKDNATRGLVIPTSMTNFVSGGANKTSFFSEDFQSYAPSTTDDPYPVPGWTRINTVPGYTWFIATAQSVGVDNGTQASLCPYGPVGSPLDEWMITPLIDATGGAGGLFVDFAFLHDNASWPFTLDLYISTTGVAPGDFTLLWEAMVEPHPNMEWSLATVDLSFYSSQPFYLAWRYEGEDANLAGIDDIVVYDATAPVGRCCYGEGMIECMDNMELADCGIIGGNWTEGVDCTDPCLPPAVGRCCYGVDMLECAENSEAACIALSGDWAEGLACTDPCPEGPVNDDPENAILIVNGETVTGNTSMATVDCPGVLDWNAIWYVFEAPYAENDVYLNYCGTPADIYTIGIVVYPGALPLDCNAYMLADAYAFNDCGDGTTNPDMSWTRLPGPATYLIPVLADDGPLKAGMDFSFDFTVIETPPLPPGGSCADPYTLSLGSGDLPHTESGLLTCGLGNAYSNTCLGSYDGGEDFIMELTLTEELELKITMDPLGTTWSGFMIADACGDVDPCIDYVTSSSGTAKSITGLVLPAGTYYIMVDTWPTPDCIPEFTLTFEAPPAPTTGDNCGDPYIVKLPDDMVGDVFEHTSYTCGRVDNYNATCLGYYDGGEDMIYMFDVGATGSYDILLSSSTTYKGMSIDNECPDTDESCIASATAYSGDVTIFNVTMDAGYYYMQVDTWPSPDCIPEFTITITPAGGPTEGDSWELCVALGGEVVDLPFETITATPDGPGSCMTSPNIWYCYTPDATGPGTVTLCGSSFDTKLAVYDGVDPFTAVQMGCNDDSDCAKDRALQSTLTDLPFVKDEVYLIEVGGYSSSTGDGILNISVLDCPDIPENDNCEDVTPVTLTHGVSVDLVGNNECASNQCVSFPGPHTWHAFTLATTMDVTLDYCGQASVWGNAWLNLATACPCDGFTDAGAYDFTDCGDGNVTIVWNDLPAGTYYYPVMKDVGNGSVGPYTLHVVGMAPSLLTADPGEVDFGIQAAGSMGSMTLLLGADGPGDINVTISPDYSKSAGHVGNVPYLELGSVAPGPKAPYSGPQNEPSVNKQGGEDIGSAVVIGSLPHTSTGSTSGMVDDYDEACPYTGSTAPDAVYAFTPGANMIVDVSLCNAGTDYDTKMFIYEGSYTPGAPFACNDDECPGYISELLGLSLTGGTTYYIVIDGYGGGFGNYELTVIEFAEPDPFECPEGATAESEACGDDTNGGCNMATPAFEPIVCGQTVCGTIWADGSSRDTDWYSVEFFVETEVTINGSGNFPFVMGFIDTADCALAAAIDPYAAGNPNDVVAVSRTCGPGVYWLFVSHQAYEGYPCGTSNDYWINLDCPDGPVLWLSADPTSGVVPAGGTLPISVNYDATELANGVYSAALKVTHDGRGEMIIPCSIEIGDVIPPDTLALEPAAVNWMMVNDVEGADLAGNIFIGDDLGWVNPVVTSVSRPGGGTIPCTQEIIEYYPGLTGPVLKLTFDLSDFAALYDDGLMWDCDARSYTVAGTDDAGAIGAGDDFTYCGHISGDLNLDHQVDISDLVFMVSYMFNGGPAPEIIEMADITGDGSVDIADLVAFVDYMFNGGSAPQHP